MVSKTKSFAKTLQKDFCRAAWHGGRAGGCHGSAISVPPPPPNQALLNSQYSILPADEIVFGGASAYISS